VSLCSGSACPSGSNRRRSSESGKKFRRTCAGGGGAPFVPGIRRGSGGTGCSSGWDAAGAGRSAWSGAGAGISAGAGAGRSAGAGTGDHTVGADAAGSDAGAGRSTGRETGDHTVGADAAGSEAGAGRSTGRGTGDHTVGADAAGSARGVRRSAWSRPAAGWRPVSGGVPASARCASSESPGCSVFPCSWARYRATASSRRSSSAIAVRTRCRRSSGMSGRSTRIGVPGETVAPGTRRGSGGPPLSSAMRPPPGARAPKRTRAWTAEHTLLGQFNRNRSLSWANYLRCRIAREAAANDVIAGGHIWLPPGVPPPPDAESGLARHCTTAPIIRAGGSKRPAGDRHVPAWPLRAGPWPRLVAAEWPCGWPGPVPPVLRWRSCHPPPEHA
jgi:hypothetical protein